MHSLRWIDWTLPLIRALARVPGSTLDRQDIPEIFTSLTKGVRVSFSFIHIYSGGNDKWYFDFKVKYLHQYLTKSQIQYHHRVALWILHLMIPSYVQFDEILTKLEGKYKKHFLLYLHGPRALWLYDTVP